MQPIPIELISTTDILQTGDEVQITTRDGKVLELEVWKVTGDKMIGKKKEEVAFSNIAKIERRKIIMSESLTEAGKKMGIYLLAAVGGVVLALLIASATGGI